MTQTEIVKSWTVGRLAASTNSAQTTPPEMIEVEALTIINVGKGHYMPGQRFYVAPGRADELIEAELVKKVGTGEVPKEARADDGGYAEEPATPTAVDLARTKQDAGQALEETVTAESEKDAAAANKAVDEAETAKDETVTGVKEDKTTTGRQTKEDKAAK